MSFPSGRVEAEPRVVAGFSAYPWDHSLTTLRLSAPICQAGMQFIRGGEYDQVDLTAVSCADLIVIQRDFPRYATAYEKVTTQAHREGKPVVYEIDDLLLELPDDHPDHGIHYYAQAAFPMLQAIVEADAVTATSPALCAYLRSFNSQTYLLPNYLPDALWKTSRPDGNPGNEPVVIGYMGSDTHRPDLELIAPALEGVLKKYGNKVQLLFLGAEPPAGLSHLPQVVWKQLDQKNYPQFAADFLQQKIDLFVAPLQDTLFNRCKSSIKYYEYSALGVPGIFSRVTPYECVIEHGVNGFLASSVEEWTEELTGLIDDVPLRQRVGSAAWQSVINQGLLSTHAHLWSEAYRKILQLRGSREPEDFERAQALSRISTQVQGWIDELNNRISEKDHTLNEIQRSRAWKLLQIAWGIRRKLTSLFH